MDNNDVTVLLVWNGPGVASKWQLGDIITALKKRKNRNGEEDVDDDEDDLRTSHTSKRARERN